MYVADRFQKPYPFTPDVVIDIDGVIDRKIEALAQHASQYYEWLPYNGGYLDQVPEDHSARRRWFAERIQERLHGAAQRFRTQLVQRYGEQRGAAVRYAEAFEACEYGAPLTPEAAARLFPESL
jgi:hypothetical protein